MLFYVDGHLYETQTNWASSTANPYPFPFDQSFFLLMNMAIGGSYLGYASTNQINSGTSFPSEMLIDYVRLYRATDSLLITLKKAGSHLLLSWPSNIVCRLQMKTSPLASGLGTNWVTLSPTNDPIQTVPGNAVTFYRLISP